MEMKVQITTMEDFTDIQKLYRVIIEKTSDMEKYARWKIGMHPTDALIMDYIRKGAMMQYRIQGNIAGALAVTMEQGEDYHDIDWGIKALDHEVAVIHILGVNPTCQKRGIGSQMIDDAIELARKNGKKAIRLDALASNTPAQHMYQSKGFIYHGVKNQFAENTGWTDFYFYEYLC